MYLSGDVISDTAPGGQPLGFAGGVYDPDTKLVHFGVRDYDPRTGRWYSKDPIGFAGRAANLYEYASNDPITFSDREGKAVNLPQYDEARSNAETYGAISESLFAFASAEFDEGQYGEAFLDTVGGIGTGWQSIFDYVDSTPSISLSLNTSPVGIFTLEEQSEYAALQALTEEAMGKGYLTREEAEALTELAREKGWQGRIDPAHVGTATDFAHAHVIHMDHLPIGCPRP